MPDQRSIWFEMVVVLLNYLYVLDLWWDRWLVLCYEVIAGVVGAS